MSNHPPGSRSTGLLERRDDVLGAVAEPRIDDRRKARKWFGSVGDVVDGAQGDNMPLKTLPVPSSYN
jgi:hypothetical protein